MGAKKVRDKNHRDYIVLMVLTGLMVVLVVIALVFYAKQLDAIDKIQGADQKAGEYGRHFAMIVDDFEDEFWQGVFEGAQKTAESNGAYLELMGSTLSVSYTNADLIKMAIASRVDGIMIEPDGTDEVASLIEEAALSGIPVVTMLHDEAESKRVSYVGVSYYNLGQQYAEQISAIIRNKGVSDTSDYKVMVLMDNDINDSSRTIVYSTIQDVLGKQKDIKSHVTMEARMIESGTAFSAEESIRNIFMSEKELPDIMVCLDETCSACVYQALVDYNQVGQVELVAYYTGGTIISGIGKNIISSTTGVDTSRMGASGIEALLEYIKTGFTSDYYSVDTFIVDQSSIAGYLGGENN